MEKKNQDNEIKWAPIQLMIQFLLGNRKGIDAKELCNQVFNVPVTLSQKYDGTNVGKDENGEMYGRNKMIGPKESSYQKTDLKCVKAIDAAKMKESFIEATGLDPALIEKFVVYGELMCNPNLYDYTKNGVHGSFQLFGAMVLPANEEAQEAIFTKSKEAGFCILKEEVDPDIEDEVASLKLQICFNKSYAKLAEKEGYATVPMVGEYESFYDAVMTNQEWMRQGLGEGLIVVSKDYIKKWKIGAEANATNKDLLTQALFMAEDTPDVFGDDLKKMVEFLKICEEIQKSNKQLIYNPDEEYEIAIKSAMTKFDSHDKYEYEEYLTLIVDETKTDIKVKEGKKPQEAHKKNVQRILKNLGVVQPKKVYKKPEPKTE